VQCPNHMEGQQETAMSSQNSPDLEQPDLTDLDRWVGVPIGGLQANEPLSVSDVRRFVQAFANPNPLHFDAGYAAESRFERIVAPQSCFGSGVADTVHMQGTIPGSHNMHGGDECWFYGPRFFPGDMLRQDRMMFDYRAVNTRFAGPSVIARGDTTFVNQRGGFIAKQRATAIRYLVDNASKIGSLRSDDDPPEWTIEQLEEIAEQRVNFIRSTIGHGPRHFDSVDEGDRLPPYVIGPHSIATFTTELRAFRLGGWGSADDWRDLPYTDDPGWIPELRAPERRDVFDPVAFDMLNFGTGRGHQVEVWAQRVGMPRAYGYGPSLSKWVTDYLSNWAGEWGFVRYRKFDMRHPILSGDATFLNGVIVGKESAGAQGFGTVVVEFQVTNQDDQQVASGVGRLELPFAD
jgi:acyl dehydratase